LTKLGVTLLILSVAFVWTRYAAGPGWSWVRQFGTTSLLVYWVHIELVYGRELFFLKGSLNEAQTLVAAVFVILLMLANFGGQDRAGRNCARTCRPPAGGARPRPSACREIS
jgi:fucose 4-O-acetylase-like acetyltransferase